MRYKFNPKRMKALREENNLTLQQLADEAGSAKSYIWELENGRSEPGLILGLNIAAALGVTAEYLCGGENNSRARDARLGASIRKLLEKEPQS